MLLPVEVLVAVSIIAASKLAPAYCFEEKSLLSFQKSQFIFVWFGFGTQARPFQILVKLIGIVVHAPYLRVGMRFTSKVKFKYEKATILLYISSPSLLSVMVKKLQQPASLSLSLTPPASPHPQDRTHSNLRNQ